MSAPMIRITLPDGSQTHDAPVRAVDVVALAGEAAAEDVLAVKVDGVLHDLDMLIEHDAPVEVITRDHPDALDLLRHGAAHVLAEAVKELYPDTQVTIGPLIENGFYYDFARDIS